VREGGDLGTRGAADLVAIGQHTVELQVGEAADSGVGDVGTQAAARIDVLEEIGDRISPAIVLPTALPELNA
jgi:hypothetical protein